MTCVSHHNKLQADKKNCRLSKHHANFNIQYCMDRKEWHGM